MKYLIFIVENDVAQQKMFKVHLEEVLGKYTVKPFPNPADLIEHLKEKPFAVVLAHFFGPEVKTGVHYLMEMKKQYPLIPVIYYTTHEDPALRAEVMALGAEEYILKDSASLVRLRTTLDSIHTNVISKKYHWRNLIKNVLNMGNNTNLIATLNY